jgi:predicted RNA-binding Zn ribbon-like protein
MMVRMLRMHSETISAIRINGGRLCLDFVNTAAWDGGIIIREFLLTPRDARIWAERQALVVPDDDALSDDSVTQLHAFRQTLRMLLIPRDAGGGKASDQTAAAQQLQEIMMTVLPALCLIPSNRGWQLAAPCGSGLASVLGPVALSALDVLTSEARTWVKMCPGDACNWLFLDATRNRTRRWCSMESCGNRVKARTHYQTHRAPADADPLAVRARRARRPS